MRIAAVRVFVSDVARAAAWYGQVLGTAPTAGGPDAGYVVFDAGCHLVVESVGEDSEIPAERLVGRFTGISLAVDDVDAVCRSLREAGVDVAGEPEVQGWGGVLATLADPDGNAVQLVQYP